MYQDKKSKKSIARDGLFANVQIGLGALMTFVFALTLFYTLFDEVDDGATMAIVFVVLTLLSVMLMLRGFSMSKMIKLFRVYVLNLAKDPTHSIQQLAKVLNASADMVRKNIQKMIDRGYFQDAYIDIEYDCLTLLGPEKIQMPKAKRQETVVERITVNCGGCGAINHIEKGTLGECEFCRSPLTV